MLNDCIGLCFSHTVKDTSFPGELTATKVKEFMDIMSENKTRKAHRNGVEELLERRFHTVSEP